MDRTKSGQREGCGLADHGTGQGSALGMAIKAEQWRVNGNFKMTPLRWALRRVNRQQGVGAAGQGYHPLLSFGLDGTPPSVPRDKCDAMRSSGASSEIELSIVAMHFRVQLERKNNLICLVYLQGIERNSYLCVKHRFSFIGIFFKHYKVF